jgi:autoinducer 2 (AI-2) kinase
MAGSATIDNRQPTTCRARVRPAGTERRHGDAREDELSDCVLVIDAGTGSVRAVVFDVEGGQRGVSQEEWTHIAEPGVPGSMVFDTHANWQRVMRCVAGALGEAGIAGNRIRAVTSTSMREGLVLYDGAGREIWACANADSRAGAEVRELKGRGLEREFYEESGQTFALGALPCLTGCAGTAPQSSTRCAPSPCLTTG